jgi:hypothetical protein
MEEIKVLVPIERVPEFYRWFADWRDGVTPEVPTQPAASAAPSTSGTEPAQELSAAVEWWRSLRPSERAVWGIWIDAAPRMVTADTIVKELNLKGARDIPGILSWSGRKGYKAGFKVVWRFRTDPLSGEPIYGIEDVEYAELLRRAREEAS